MSPPRIVGHAVAELTDGFVLFGRWMRLARAAVEDLIRSLPEQDTQRPGYWERTMLFLATRLPDETVFLDEPASTMAAIETTLGAGLIEDLRLPIPSNGVKVIALGHGAGAAALNRAASSVGVHCDRALIVAVDSLLDPIVIEQLASQHRLKHGDNSAGLIPGEAAAALLVEPTQAVEPDRVLAVLSGISLQQPLQEATEVPNRIGTLAECFLTALDQAGLSELDGDVYIDVNGEPWRAHQWGMALLQIQGRFKGSVEFPAISVGDVGAAGGVLAICLACRAFERSYAGGAAAAVLTSGEAGDSTCVIVESGRT